MTPSTADRRSRTRCGFTVFEVVIAMFLLGTVIAIVVPVTKRAIDQRQRAEDRRAALMEVSNVLERAVADPAAWPEAGKERALSVSDALAGRFREPRLTLTATVLEESPAGRRLDAAFSWSDEAGRPAAPIRLSAFAFETSGGQAEP